MVIQCDIMGIEWDISNQKMGISVTCPVEIELFVQSGTPGQ